MERYELEDGSIILEGVNEIPREARIFTKDQYNYIEALIAPIILRELKGQLLNIIEGIGLPDKQETAVKRLITGQLYETRESILDSLDLVVSE